MCGRYTLTTPADLVAQVFRLGVVSEYPPRWNIAPTQLAPVIRVDRTTGERRLDLLRWGLIPFWAKTESVGAKMINARVESVAGKPPFAQLLERRRCLVPADAFYEWLKPESTKQRKQPFAIRLKGDRVFAFAGLWDRWKNENGEKIESYTILTTQPNEVAGRYHDRMPVMLISPEQWDRWLDQSLTGIEALKPMLTAPPDETMHAYPVSPRVNSADNDDADLLRELPAPHPAETQRSLFEA